jgi:hypothetical protein
VIVGANDCSDCLLAHAGITQAAAPVNSLLFPVHKKYARWTLPLRRALRLPGSVTFWILGSGSISCVIRIRTFSLCQTVKMSSQQK